LFFTPSGKKSTVQNIDKFQIQDTSQITSVIIESENFHNELVQTDSGWTINNKYLADQGIVIILFSVIKNIEVLRTIGEAQWEEKTESSDGINVSIKKGNETLLQFKANSNPTKTLSIFSKDNESYVVNLPGYDSYVTGIFEIPESDWRSRLIVSLGPLNMNAIKVNHLKKPDQSFEVQIENNFPLIPGINSIDTLLLLDYLEQFGYFQVDQFVEKGKNPGYDSLLTTAPWIEFSLEEINTENNVSLSFFHKFSGDPNILALMNQTQPVLFNYRRISGIFLEKDDFEQGIKKPRNK
jgi:hypothetical protein